MASFCLNSRFLFNRQYLASHASRSVEHVVPFDVTSAVNDELRHAEHNRHTQQLKDARIVKCLCRVLESQVWGPNTVPLLQPYVPHLSTSVVSSVVLRQKNLTMAKKFFRWSCQNIHIDAHAYHAFLIRLGEAKEFDEMWTFLNEMRENGCTVCGTAFSIFLKAYGAAGLPEQALHAFKRTKEFHIHVDVHLYTTMLSVLFKARMVTEARCIYKKMLEDECEFDGSAWSTLIRGFGKCGFLEEAEMCWRQMVEGGAEPDLIHYNALIEGLCECRNLKKALDTLAILKEKGIKPNAYSFNPILSGLCKAGRFTDALTIFSEMECDCNQATCNMLLEGLFLDIDASRALVFFELLEKKGLVDSRTYCLLANGLKKAKKMDKLLSLSDELQCKHGVVNTWLCNAVLHFLCDQSNGDEASNYFDRMLNGLTQPDVVSFATMINGYCKVGNLQKAANLLSEMDKRGCKPNAFCYSPLIAASLKVGQIAYGLQLFKDMLKRGLETNAVISDFLLRKLSEAGIADELLWVCEHVVDNKFFVHHATRSALVHCLQKSGRLEEANAILRRLETQGCLIDGTRVDKAMQILRGNNRLLD